MGWGTWLASMWQWHWQQCTNLARTWFEKNAISRLVERKFSDQSPHPSKSDLIQKLLDMLVHLKIYEMKINICQTEMFVHKLYVQSLCTIRWLDCEPFLNLAPVKSSIFSCFKGTKLWVLDNQLVIDEKWIWAHLSWYCDCGETRCADAAKMSPTAKVPT